MRKVAGTTVRWLGLGTAAAILYEAMVILNATEIGSARLRNTIALYVLVPMGIWAGIVALFSWIAGRFDPEPPEAKEG